MRPIHAGLASYAGSCSGSARRAFLISLWTFFLLAFSALLPLINPFGSALIFVGLVGPAPAAVYRTLARKIAINNIVFLAIIELLGSAILKFFGISLPIIQVAGGLVMPAALNWSVRYQTPRTPPNHGTA